MSVLFHQGLALGGYLLKHHLLFVADVCGQGALPRGERVHLTADEEQLLLQEQEARESSQKDEPAVGQFGGDL